MSDTFENLRPGVYSRYRVSGGRGPIRSRRDAALAVTAGAPGGLSPLTALPGEGCSPTVLAYLALLLDAGVGRVWLASAEEIPQALALLEGVDVGAVIGDCAAEADFLALKEHVEAASDRMMERIGFCGADDPDRAAETAQKLCSGRVCLCCPTARVTDRPLAEASPLYGACCLAASVLTADSPAQALSGAPFPRLGEVARLPEADVQRLLESGVCVLEDLGGGVELIRGLTTSTVKGGAPDNALRSLSTALIMDDVVRHIRESLAARLGGASSPGSVGDQVAVELAAKRDAGIISDFSPPRVRADGGDPTVCLVDIGFSVAHLVSRIHLTAQIKV